MYAGLDPIVSVPDPSIAGPANRFRPQYFGLASVSAQMARRRVRRVGIVSSEPAPSLAEPANRFRPQ